MDSRERFNLLNKRYEQLSSGRSTWEHNWQDIVDFVHPDASDFNRQHSPGDRRNDQKLDGTAPWANEQLAAGLQSFLTSPTELWFNLCVKDYNYEDDPEALLWLERVQDIIYKAYQDPRTSHTSSCHETYLGLGSFGTSVLYQEYNSADRHLAFRAYPLADCTVAENSKGMIDTLFRKTMMTTRQVDQEFPDHTCQKIKEEKNQDKIWCIVHAVFPRKDRDAKKVSKTNKKFASFWLCLEAKEILDESGFDRFPYHVPRWTKRAGEVYGRSPGMTCMPDIKLLNSLEKYGLKALQKIVDPPLMTPSDGFALPIATAPSSHIYYDASMTGPDAMVPLETKGRVDINEEKMMQKREHVMKCFYADWIARMKKKERQTAVEIMDDREEMLQLMSPILGRLMTELLGPMISLSYFLLDRIGMIPPAPASIQNRVLDVVYVSPAAKAQFASKGLNIRRFTQEIIPYAQVDPTILDIINPDAYAREMALYTDVSRRILRTPKEIEELREMRKQQQAAMSAMEIAEPASKAIKNLADAKEKGVSLQL